MKKQYFVYTQKRSGHCKIPYPSTNLNRKNHKLLLKTQKAPHDENFRLCETKFVIFSPFAIRKIVGNCKFREQQ